MKQIIYFFILGIFSTLIDFVIYTVLVIFNINYIIAIIIGYSCGFLFNFFIGRKHVFKNGRKVETFMGEFSLVLVINIIAILLNILIVYVLYSLLVVCNEIDARVIAIGIVFFWNFFARKLFVYH
jgi:putative flippase GtrA